MARSHTDRQRALGFSPSRTRRLPGAPPAAVPPKPRHSYVYRPLLSILITGASPNGWDARPAPRSGACGPLAPHALGKSAAGNANSCPLVKILAVAAIVTRMFGEVLLERKPLRLRQCFICVGLGVHRPLDRRGAPLCPPSNFTYFFLDISFSRVLLPFFNNLAAPFSSIDFTY